MELFHSISPKSRGLKRKQLCQFTKVYTKKDVESCFGVIYAKWSMITYPCRVWTVSDMTDVMYTCVIMHNVIIEDDNDNDHPIFDVASSSQSILMQGFTFCGLQVGTLEGVTPPYVW
jgi:hypothetical protein